MAEVNARTDRVQDPEVDGAAEVPDAAAAAQKPAEVSEPDPAATPSDDASQVEEAGPDRATTAQPQPEQGSEAKPQPDTVAEPTATSEPEVASEPAAPPDTAQTPPDTAQTPPDTATETVPAVPPTEAAEYPAALAVPGSRPERSRSTMVVIALAAVLVLLWVVGVWSFLHHRAHTAQLQADQAALVAARTVATDLTSLSGANAQQTITRLTQETTDPFRQQIAGYAGVAQSLLQQSGAGSSGTVTAAGIEKSDASTATALVTVTAVVSNNKTPNAQPLSYRIAVDLSKVDDRWLAANVTFVQ
jgi:hypothetical protein